MIYLILRNCVPNMKKIKYNERDKLHFVWFILLIVCVVITYCYQKSKATDNYNKTLQVADFAMFFEINNIYPLANFAIASRSVAIFVNRLISLSSA